MASPVVTSNQPSLTEWLAAIGEADASNAFREEDNRKVDRLEIMYQEIGLPYERPEEMSARELTDLGPRFKTILETRGDELCAIRLVPKKPELPKLRQRGVTIRDCYENWFLKQEIDPDEYTTYICPHSETLLWSATFVIAEQGVYGEMIRGLHSQLTHGACQSELYQFSFDFHEWHWSQYDAEAETEIKRMLALLLVGDVAKREILKEKLNCTFSHDYITGYFESTVWPDNRVYIIDYNRMLPAYLPASWSANPLPAGASDTITGAIAMGGFARGLVRIVREEDVANIQLSSDEILVCDNTDVRFLPIMRSCAAIVTDRGGILSHAAIVSRELKKPCIIGTKIATQVLKDGDEVEVDAERGIVKILKRAG